MGTPQSFIRNVEQWYCWWKGTKTASICDNEVTKFSVADGPVNLMYRATSVLLVHFPSAFDAQNHDQLPGQLHLLHQAVLDLSAQRCYASQRSRVTDARLCLNSMVICFFWESRRGKVIRRLQTDLTLLTLRSTTCKMHILSACTRNSSTASS